MAKSKKYSESKACIFCLKFIVVTLFTTVVWLLIFVTGLASPLLNSQVGQYWFYGVGQIIAVVLLLQIITIVFVYITQKR